MKPIDKRLDDAWSLAVKKRADFKCEYCGITHGLNSHHIFSREKKSVRWCLDNGICLCVNHHIGSEFSPHKTPVKFIPWLIRKKGQQFIDLLTAKSNQIGKYCEFEKKEMLKELEKY
jgi:5-methylcytosine-specific restriction endonuclease McrA